MLSHIESVNEPAVGVEVVAVSAAPPLLAACVIAAAGAVVVASAGAAVVVSAAVQPVPADAAAVRFALVAYVTAQSVADDGVVQPDLFGV